MYAAAAILTPWGVAHLAATRGVVQGFSEILVDNRRILTMEWIVQAVALFAGSALVSLLIGLRIKFLAYRLCLFVLGPADGGGSPATPTASRQLVAADRQWPADAGCDRVLSRPRARVAAGM